MKRRVMTTFTIYYIINNISIPEHIFKNLRCFSEGYNIHDLSLNILYQHATCISKATSCWIIQLDNHKFFTTFNDQDYYSWNKSQSFEKCKYTCEHSKTPL